ncbi:MAG: hypothetical protein WAZ19_06195 [Anaerolineae bacterium]
MQFPLNEALLVKARAVLLSRRGVRWIVGGSTAGKSTLCQWLAAQYDLPVYDMDAHIFGTYHARLDPLRHPASIAWFRAEDPLGWALSLSLDEWYHLNRAAHAEYLDLLADDLQDTDPVMPLLIDGGVTNPSLLARVLPVEQIACLTIPPELSTYQWENDPLRVEMKQAILAITHLPDAWTKFLAMDQQIHRIINNESQQAGIARFARGDYATPQALAAAVARALAL